MVTKRAIFFAGITCGAGLEDGRIFTVDYLLPLFFRLVLVLEIHILALDEATDGFALGTFCLVKF
jgi:SNF family Na+-dependent transporter